MSEYFIYDRKLADSQGKKIPTREIPAFYFGMHGKIGFYINARSDSAVKFALVCDIDRDIGNGLCFRSETEYKNETNWISFDIDTMTDKFFSAVNGKSGFVTAYLQLYAYDKMGKLTDVLLDDFCLLSSVIGTKDELVVPFDYAKLETKMSEYADSAYASSVIASDCADEARRAETSCKLIQSSMEKRLKEAR